MTRFMHIDCSLFTKGKFIYIYTYIYIYIYIHTYIYIYIYSIPNENYLNVIDSTCLHLRSL